jgi:hypothetical protein
MRRRHRHSRRRHSEYDSKGGGVRRTVIGVGIILIVLFGAGKWVLSYFGVGNTIQRLGSTLTMEHLGNVQVSIEEGELKRAENEQKLYPGDRVITGPGSRAMLTLFDGTKIRLNEMTDVSIEESALGQEESKLTVYLQEGTVWLATPKKETYTGAIRRTLTTAVLEAALPSQTEAVMTTRSIVVFAADGIGVTLSPKNSVIPLVVGEGQKFTLPTEITGKEDLYAYRAPLDPFAIASEFVEESRKLHAGVVEEVPVKVAEDVPAFEEGEDDEALIVLSPENDTTLSLATVEISGRVGRKVSRVRVNGYNAPIDDASLTFSQELALPDLDDVEIVVVAFAEDDSVLSEIRRQVHRDRKPPESPEILLPAKTDQTYNTSNERFIIEGTAPKGTVGITVNDYRLQLFEPGNTTWTYLASTSIDNLKPGKNTYNVIAINKGGYKSEPATLTIVLGDGPEGVVEEDDEETTEEDTPTVPSEPSVLPSNTPLRPGSLRVTGPTKGKEHTATGSAFLIEGITVPETDSLWVNDYRLRLYEPGKTTWNYIADSELNTLRRGRNVYTIITRDSRGQVLDTLTYVVTYRPSRN